MPRAQGDAPSAVASSRPPFELRRLFPDIGRGAAVRVRAVAVPLRFGIFGTSPGGGMTLPGAIAPGTP